MRVYDRPLWTFFQHIYPIIYLIGGPFSSVLICNDESYIFFDDVI